MVRPISANALGPFHYYYCGVQDKGEPPCTLLPARPHRCPT